MTELPTPAVHTAVKILDLLSSESQPLSLSEISRRIGAPKSTVSRTLSTLHATRLIDLDGQTYQLGPKLLEYSVAYARNLDITRVFSRVSLEIVAQINETMQLARLEGQKTASESLGHREFVLTYKSFEPIGPSCLPLALV